MNVKSNLSSTNNTVMDAQQIKNATDFLLGSGAVGLAPQIIAGTVPLTSNLFDGKRLRKTVYRKTVDYTSFGLISQMDMMESFDIKSASSNKIQPHIIYSPEMGLPITYCDSTISTLPIRFVRQAQNKKRYPVNAITWTHDGRRLIAGSLNGELTLWNSLTFNFDTILQAHDDQIVVLSTANFDEWIISCDVKGFIKYWQSNMNNVVAFQGHLNSCITSLTFSPTDRKYVTSGIDSTVRIWDFAKCLDERVYREHGGDVCIASWHPLKSLIASGSKDAQQSIKLWDPRQSKSLSTLHNHKATVSDIKWNPFDSNYFLTASRDSNVKLLDLRNTSKDLHCFRQINNSNLNTNNPNTNNNDSNQSTFIPNKIAWNPIHANYFAVGSCYGSLQHWSLKCLDDKLFEIEDAHDSCINGVLWHPLGHILVTASSDYTSKFWSRERPGEHMPNSLLLSASENNVDNKKENNSLSNNKLISSSINNNNNVNVNDEYQRKKEDSDYIFIPPVDYNNPYIPHLGNQELNSTKSLYLPDKISIDLLQPITGDLTAVVPNAFYSDNVPKNLKNIS